MPWPFEAEKLLLDWLDQNKGHNLLEKVDDLLARYRKEDFSKDDSFVAELTKKKVENKLRWFWDQYRLPKYKKKAFSIQTFHDQGTVALDWKRLSSDDKRSNLMGLYEKEDLAARLATSSDGTSANGQAAPKRKAEEDNDEQEPSGSSGDDGETDSSDSISIITDEPPAQTAKTESGRPAKRQNLHADSAIDSEIQLPDEPFIGSSTTREDTLLATGLSTQKQSEIMPASEKQQDLQAASEKQAPPSGTPGPSAPQNNLLADLEVLGVLSSGSIGVAFVDKNILSRDMEVSFSKIERAVTDYLATLELKNNQPILLDADLAYPQELTTLLDGVLGGRTAQIEQRRDRFALFQQQNKVGYEYFLRSLIAYAVVCWCYRNIVDEEAFFVTFGSGLAMRTFERWLLPEIQIRLRRKLFETHINEQIIPHIRSKAEIMAQRMLNFVDLLLPRLTSNSLTQKLDIVACPLTDPGWVDTERLPSDPFEQPTGRVQFRTKLVNIFDEALNWRAKLSCQSIDLWWFSFPAFQEPYQSEYKHIKSQSQQPYDHVVLGLSPLVWREPPKTFGKQQLMCQGAVV